MYLWFLAFLVLGIVLSRLIGRPSRTNSVAFTNVTVIDGTGSAPKPGMTVTVADGRITGISAGRLEIPKNTIIVDGSGKFLLPGFWDMHVHIQRDPELNYGLFIANGVTAVRDMGGPLDRLKKWSRQTERRTMIGPRIVFAGPYLDGPGALWAFSLIVRDAEEARRDVRMLVKNGVDFIKVQSWLSREAYLAIADESRKQGVQFAGHVPDAVSAIEAAELGQKSIEHLTGILLACSRQEGELRVQSFDHTIGVLSRVEKQGIESYDRQRAAALFHVLATRGTWQVPTLVIFQVRASGDDYHLIRDERLKYVPIQIRKSWIAKTDLRLRFMSPEYVAIAGQLFAKYLELVHDMHEAGVKFMAGTDTPFPFCVPGFSLHDELKLLVKAGLSPMEAIQAATCNPAVYWGMAGSTGTVETGKRADLILLRANPLDDIGNTTQIEAVVSNGHYYPRQELDNLLADAATMATK